MIKDEIQFLLTLFLLLSGSLLLLLFYLVIRKARENRLKRRVEEQKQAINDKLLHSILTGEALRSLQADSKAKALAIEQLLSHYADFLEGEAEKKNLEKLAESLLLHHYRKGLRKPKWSTRMNALFYIETFRMAALKEEILAMLKHKRVTKEEQVRALTILAEFQAKEMFRLLMDEYKDLSHLEYRNILSRVEDRGFEQFLLGYHSCHSELQYALLDLVGLKKNLQYLQFIESVFSASNGEERIRALKALASVGFVQNMEVYLPLLKSANWQERMLSARLAGAMKLEQALPDLVELLQDSSWWVRSQAGQSIMSFPQGRVTLEKVMAESNDTFARDMAWEWMNKGVHQS
ncbi:HEAT repeat domain-containing protein [Mesobacillus subterraneus]|uniref:HEAT repeat domain-containing protein n=1 Tax=Mesobacillus subterraneus TaxID=285983 RepID=A0A427TXJ0_9BACI|nr:HEAT repeat domain-containing protein [Mesobacillus subterraneus]RSD29193.1 HEAT repeat domain-containing protein [Mesobacillus subterraneus]